MDKKIMVDGQEYTLSNLRNDGQRIEFSLEGKAYKFNLAHRQDNELLLEAGERFKAAVGLPGGDGESVVMAMGREALLSLPDKQRRKKTAAAGGLVSPMPGKIFKIIKPAGSEVTKGETILVLEAMKMEHAIRSDKDGRVTKILFKEGELVQGGILLAEVE
jgi:biotin carboxyl carrier protein